MNHIKCYLPIAFIMVMLCTSCEPRLTIRDTIIGEWQSENYYTLHFDSLKFKANPKITFNKDLTYTAENFPIPITMGTYYVDIGERLISLSDDYLLQPDTLFIRGKNYGFVNFPIPDLKIYTVQWFINIGSKDAHEVWQYFDGLKTEVKAYGRPEGEYFPIHIEKIK